MSCAASGHKTKWQHIHVIRGPSLLIGRQQEATDFSQADAVVIILVRIEDGAIACKVLLPASSVAAAGQ